MKIKLFCSIAVASLCLSSLSHAQPSRQDAREARQDMQDARRDLRTAPDRRSANEARRDAREARSDLQDARQDRREARRYYNARTAEFRRGGRLPQEMRDRQYVVNDWRSHRLAAPPRGHHWVQVGPDYVLAAVATGIIANLILSQ
jgi:Ni/Co efflux regulator RcnB